MIYDSNDFKTAFDFDTEEKYEEYLKANPPFTLQNERVKSYGELAIANYLIQNQVKYIYEMSYPVDTATSEFGQYHPDFYLPEYDLYIEYFGIGRDGNVPEFFHGREKKKCC